jgi:AraC family transcriptional regulator of adaptative response / methylphosphotriester-DNA alkyltransferase methyltransferase
MMEKIMDDLSKEEMLEAVYNCDANYDGIFFYGVRSTGIFCRPSCRTRPPKHENVVFFRTAEEAMEAGFRPCRRCRSDLLTYHPMEEIAADLKDHIDRMYMMQSEWRRHTRELGISERRMTDIFKETYGMTPKAYTDKLRLEEAERMLKATDEKIIDIAASAGFGSLAAFNRSFRAKTGMTPSAYRKKNQ